MTSPNTSLQLQDPLDAENPYLPPRSPQLTDDLYSPWRRVIVTVLCTAASGLGLSVSLGLVLLGPAILLSGDTFTNAVKALGQALLVAYAWAAYFRMAWGWIRNRPVSTTWPRFGTAAGLICSAMVNVGVVAVLPAVGLAIHLVRFHLGHPDNQPRAQW